MIRPITDHEYQINGGAWIACSNSNTISNGYGTYTIIDGNLNADIPAGKLKVRVKSISGNPPSAVLVNFTSFSGLVVDNDAQAYLTAAGIQPGQTYTAGNNPEDFPLASDRVIRAVNQMFVELKAAGIYNKLRALYPFLGPTNANNFVNAVNPGTYDLVPTGAFGATFGRYGISFDGASSLKTGIFLSDFGENNISSGLYLIGNGGGFDYGVQYSGTYQYGSSLPNFIWYKWYQQETTGAANRAAISGLNIMNMQAANLSNFYSRGVKLLTSTKNNTPSATFAGKDIWLGNLNSDNAYHAGGCSTSTYGLFFLSTGLTDAESVTMTNIIEKWAFLIGRNKGEIPYNTFQFFGDSITFGQVAAPAYHAWSKAITYYRRATEKNWGVNGTTIVDCNTTAINNLIPKGGNYTKVFLAFSTNDCRNDNLYGTMNIEMFATNYAAVIDKIFAAGYQPDDVAIISGYAMSTTDTDQHPGLAALQDQYIQRVATVAAAKGITRVFNMKAAMFASGGEDFISGIHPNNAGHDFIGSYLNASLGPF
ncbi:SGNH/GDSL hydrolase family protein [Mucilaginibacter terrenus]|uniref:SGNH/GDSL hydrolase family protein n=1 Tax=Mucilaginibacter terrenus TaxID=2482727 RepID=A0A3E2NV80_9SPHI|nr:SGNH/GDSL hydrolase family protein [Mucilaginibacter terrenus]RFZ84760.1 SGNH/GDSL hydrolase family protein [Mucilaginibacter terrenus]